MWKLWLVIINCFNYYKKWLSHSIFVFPMVTLFEEMLKECVFRYGLKLREIGKKLLQESAMVTLSHNLVVGNRFF